MDEYKIRYATECDIPKIKKYIDENWKKNHILAREKGFFEWQYTSDKIDYIIATDSNEEIQGMIGFISYDYGEMRDIATSMWKANVGTGFLGIKLLMYLQKNEKYRTLFSPGINVSTSEGIYKRMGILTGRMNHWYRLNLVKEYKIAKIVDDYIPSVEINNLVKVVEYKKMEDFTSDFDYEEYVSRESVPYKSKSYVNKRYFNHPIYKYMIYGIKVDGINTSAVIVFRIQEYNGSKVIRLVDCIGDLHSLLYITHFLDDVLIKENAEYFDIYEKGVPDGILYKAGWKLVPETSNIIPNYFSPFEQRNVEIYYCTTDDKIVLFKGDGDQDRPN